MTSLFQYLTFGKPGRLGELIIGAMVLGGASKFGALPSGIVGSRGVAVIIFCVIAIWFVGIRIGNESLSPLLNRWYISGIIGLLHLSYITFALHLVSILRGSAKGLDNPAWDHIIQLSALVSILTLGYIFTLYRTSKLSAEGKKAKKSVQELSENLSNCEGSSRLDPSTVQSIIIELRETAEEIPESDFQDVVDLKTDLEDTSISLDHLDPDSAREIITKADRDSNELTEKYEEAQNLYEGIKQQVTQM